MSKFIPSSKKARVVGSFCIIFAIGWFFKQGALPLLGGRSVGKGEKVENTRRAMRKPLDEISRMSKAEREDEYDAIFAAILARNPGLEPEWKDVPDEENGFLQWMILMDRLKLEYSNSEGGALFSKELYDLQNTEDGWDSERAADLAEKYGDIIKQMKQVALLGQQSSANMPIERLLDNSNGGFSRSASMLVLLSARVAAENGDATTALEGIEASRGVAEHYVGIETGSLMGLTISMAIQLGVLDTQINHILPELDLDRNTILSLRRNPKFGSVCSQYAHILRGDFMTICRGVLVPELAKARPFGVAMDDKSKDSLVDAYAQGFLYAINKLDSLSDREVFEFLKSEEELFVFNVPKYVPDSVKNEIEGAGIGSKIFLNRLLKSHTRYNLNDAAMAMLAGEEVPLEWVTGLPYVYDEERGTLSLPDDPRFEGMNLKPIQVALPSGD